MTSKSPRRRGSATAGGANATVTTETHVLVAVPRSAFSVTEKALAVSQVTAERVLGIPRRVFLRLSNDYERAGGAVRRVGRLRCVSVEPFMSWLDTRATHGAAGDRDDGDAIDGLAAELGLQRTR